VVDGVNLGAAQQGEGQDERGLSTMINTSGNGSFGLLLPGWQGLCAGELQPSLTIARESKTMSISSGDGPPLR
jgi:hypothetical protein